MPAEQADLTHISRNRQDQLQKTNTAWQNSLHWATKNLLEISITWYLKDKETKTVNSLENCLYHQGNKDGILKKDEANTLDSQRKGKKTKKSTKKFQNNENKNYKKKKSQNLLDMSWEDRTWLWLENSRKKERQANGKIPNRSDQVARKKKAFELTETLTQGTRPPTLLGTTCNVKGNRLVSQIIFLSFSWKRYDSSISAKNWTI